MPNYAEQHSSVESLRDDLLDFIQCKDTRTFQMEHAYEHLEDFIVDWLASGDGVVKSGGDYGLYLHAIHLAVSAWIADPSVVNYIGDPTNTRDRSYERKLKSFLRPTHYHPCLERASFGRKLIELQAGDHLGR